jgi:hypothetical protein
MEFIEILDIIHYCPALFSKQDVSETEFWLRLHMELLRSAP